MPRPLALVLDLALALGIVFFEEDLVTLEVDLGLVADLLVVCGGIGLAMAEDEGREMRRELVVYEVQRQK